MNVLGIHVGHDSSAALVADNHLIADVAEERFRRLKHYGGVPTRAIAYCLAIAAERELAVDAIAVAGRTLPEGLRQWLGATTATTTTATATGEASGAAGARESLAARARRLAAAPAVAPPLYLARPNLPPGLPLTCVDHHRAHAGSAYYTSGRSSKQLVVTIDGIGDGRSVCLWRGEHGRLEPLLELDGTASIGWFYGCVTEALGWWHGDGEGKTMGLAAFGDASRCHGCLEPWHPVFADGALVTAREFGRPAYWPESAAMHWHLAVAEEMLPAIKKHGREHVAAEAQRVLEEQVCALVHPWIARERVDALSCAGGVFLNVRLNQRLWQTSQLRAMHVFPNAGDAGLAAGAALDVAAHAAPHHAVQPLNHVYLGPEFTTAEIEACLDTRRLTYRRVDDPAMAAAQLIAEGRSVGWVQGRMECGPRALGNRSILMDARDRRNVNVLNHRVKMRESFRPYCPSLLSDSGPRYLDDARDAPFMTTSFHATDGAMAEVPAAVHVDGTVRPQTVESRVNPLFHSLIENVGELTGQPIVLNTSFNLGGDPLVNSPSDALRAFVDSGLDVLVIDHFELRK